MKKHVIGIGLGAVAGIIDVIPMVFMKLTWDANFSAFSMWVVIGFLISTSAVRINRLLKGLLISFLVLLPSAVLIGWTDPMSLFPIILMTTILGALLGLFIDIVINKKQE